MFTLILVTWLLSGSASFVYWWTTEYDLTIWSLLGSLAVGIVLGPVAYVAGWAIHGEESVKSDNPFIVMKKRK